MREPLTNEEIEKLAVRKLSGESYRDIRQELKAEGHDDETIRHIIMRVDDVVLERERHRSRLIETKNVRLAGYALATVGVLLYATYYLRFWQSESYRLVIFIPMVTGLVLIWVARIIERRQNR